LSKDDADAIAKLLHYAIENQVIANRNNISSAPTVQTRLHMEDLGVLVGAVTPIGALTWDFSVQPNSKSTKAASKRAILIENKSPVLLRLSFGAQPLTQAARQLISIAKLDATELEYLKEIAEALAMLCQQRYSAEYSSGLIQIHVGDIEAVSEGTGKFTCLHTIGRDVPPTA
jgi:hypothetical protein